MPTQQPRAMVTLDPAVRSALAFLQRRYGLPQAALMRLAVRRMAEAEGWRWEPPASEDSLGDEAAAA